MTDKTEKSALLNGRAHGKQITFEEELGVPEGARVSLILDGRRPAEARRELENLITRGTAGKDSYFIIGFIHFHP